jgi:hypothetical protein
MSFGQITKRITLYSVSPVQVLLFKFDLGLIAEPLDKSTLIEMWEKANKAYSKIGTSTRSHSDEKDVRSIKNVDESKIENLLARVKQYPTYNSHPTGIYYVRISKLVTPQLSINLEHARMRSNITKDLTADELFDVMFDSTSCSENITRQTLALGSSSGAMLFTSYDEDMRFYHPPSYRKIPLNEKDPKSQMVDSVCLELGGGYPFASAYRVQIGEGKTRLILNNGIHRVFKLAENGYDWCPLVVTDMAPADLPDSLVDLSKIMLLNPKSNPPLISDFLNEDVTIPLSCYRVLKTVRLNWNFEQYETVLK